MLLKSQVQSLRHLFMEAVVSQARAAVQEFAHAASVGQATTHIVNFFQSLNRMQKRNLGMFLLLAFISALTRQKKAAALSLALNLAVFRTQAWPNRSDKYFDAVGGLTHFSLAILSVLNQTSSQVNFSKNQILNTVCSTAWSVRLGTFLFSRALLAQPDPRFVEIKKDYDSLAFAFSAQALWCFVGQLPLLVSNARAGGKRLEGEEDAGGSPALFTLGRALFLAGFLLEIVSDAQKSAFRFAHPDGQSFIRDGLWSRSRHPNMLGEILLQFGLTLSASRDFRGADHLAWLSPALTTFLLVKGTGIPMLEEVGLKKWGTDPAYQQYLRDTPVLIPKLF